MSREFFTHPDDPGVYYVQQEPEDYLEQEHGDQELFLEEEAQSFNDRILSLILGGNAQYEFRDITSTANGHTATFRVFRDSLKVFDPDSGQVVRVICSAELQQQIADLLNCSLLTPRLADLIFANRDQTLDPLPIPPPPPDNWAGMIYQSQRIDDALAQQGGDLGGIISTVGKHWVLIKKLSASVAANYGWHFLGSTFKGLKGEASVSLPGIRVIQGVGTRHNTRHRDYSQNCVLVSRWVNVDGQEVLLSDVLQDPEYAPLASHEGVVPFARQPGVQELASIVSGDVPTSMVVDFSDNPTSSSENSEGISGPAALAGGLLLGALALGVVISLEKR